MKRNSSIVDDEEEHLPGGAGFPGEEFGGWQTLLGPFRGAEGAEL